MSPPDTETDPEDGSTLLRRVRGPEAEELYFRCRPASPGADVAAQATSAYRTLLERLRAAGASPASLVSEALFLANPQQDLEPVLEVRRRVLGSGLPRAAPSLPAAIGQAPLQPRARLEIAALAWTPRRGESLAPREVTAVASCGCKDCARLSARLVQLAGETHAYSGPIYGAGDGAFEEAYAMFEQADALLRRAGLGIDDVVRTWIYLRHMDRDYAEFNRARSEFFRRRGVEIKPASTAVGGEPCAEAHDLCLRLYALRSPRPRRVEVMSTPTLNEAWMYGSDFSRGLRSEDANKVALLVSGTASVDEAGRTVHVGDFRGQAKRMLLNIASLLEAQGASFRDLTSAVAYVKRAEDAASLKTIFHEEGFEGFPCTVVEAPICRPDLLCETEAVAVLPLQAGTGSPARPK